MAARLRCDVNIRKKTLLGLGLTLVGMVVAACAFSDAFLLSSYRDLEARNTRANLQRARNVLGQEIGKLHGLSPDWSEWDDTYKFMGDHNRAYVDANLSVVSIKVDLQMFLDKSGRLFEAREVQRLPGVAPPKAEEVRAALGFDGPQQRWKIYDKGLSGLVRLSDGPVMVSVRPIRDTAGKAPYRGWLVFALRLENSLAKELARTAHQALTFYDLSQVSTDPGAESALLRAQNGEGPRVSVLDSRTIAGYDAVLDLNGSPIGVLKVTENRDIYAQGARAVAFFVLAFSLGAALIASVVYYLLEVLVIRRLMSLTSQVERIDNRVDRMSGVLLYGKDELGKLASRINQMLVRIRDGKKLLELKNQSLKRSVEELATTNVALENAVEGIARLDKDGRIVTANISFANAFGASPDEIVGTVIEDYLPRAQYGALRETLDDLDSNQRVVKELEAKRLDGSLFFCESMFLLFVSPEGDAGGCYWFLRDISDRKMLEVKIQHQAFHDSLTGLPNRMLFLDRLTSSLARTKRHKESLAVIFIDLDNFKIVNDTFGHDAGDELLVTVSTRIRSCVRPEDTVARLGGDEFTVLLSDLASEDDVIAVATRILEVLGEPIALKGGETYATASLGIRYAHSYEDAPEDILRDADTAMYRAKSMGKAAYALFDSSMNVQSVEKQELETGLRTALSSGELQLAYQPIVELESGIVTGMEALLRWHHPKLGPVPPNLFVPIAEDIGWITDIGNWALEEACRQTRAWNEKFGSRLVVSVNVSGRQIQAHEAFKAVEAALERTNLAPELLKLEFSESTLMKQSGDTLDNIHRLKELGVKIAVDDFGTGYSSLSMLAQHPIDTVKIDRSFIVKLCDSRVSEGVIRAIITMSQTLNIEVTAEGIERWEQLAQLKRLGCSNAQGYMFFAPMHPTEFEEELATGLLFRRFKVSAA